MARPSVQLSELELARIVESVAKAIEEDRRRTSGVDYETHRRHHLFMDALIAEREARRRLWEKLTQHVVQWGAIGIISFLAWAAWQAFKTFVHRL